MGIFERLINFLAANHRSVNVISYGLCILGALSLGRYLVNMSDVTISNVLLFAAFCWAGGIFFLLILQEGLNRNANHDSE